MAGWTLKGRWVFPVSAAPIPNGIVRIEGERILAVEPTGTRSADVDLGNVAILPGLVNAHTHLDLSGMRGLAPPSPDFTGWLRQVIAHRRSRAPEQVQGDIRAGLVESIRAGVTLLGDISGDGSSWDQLASAPVRAVVFRELLGLPMERAEQADRVARDWLTSHRSTWTCRPALSPHAPFSVRRVLFAWAENHAHNWQVPLAIHLAESAAEIELLRHRRGPLVRFLEDLGVWDSSDLVTSPVQVLRLLFTSTPQLIIHGNYLPPSAPLRKNQTIVYCPRTHAAFGHPPHPFREFLRRKRRVALGTDGLASNPDLDILAEARFVHQCYPDFPGDVLLRMITLSGAEALGWAEETGSLAPGKSADLVVLPLEDREGASPHQLVFASSQRVRAVLIRGQWAHDSEGALGSVFA